MSTIDQIRSIEGVRRPFREVIIDLQNVPKRGLPPFLVDLKQEDRFFRFLIQPREWVLGDTKIVNETFTRGGWIFEHVGDELQPLQITGDTAAFRDPETSGLTTENRVKSSGYRNLLHLIDVYRSNGRVFEVPLYQTEETRSKVGFFDFRQSINRIVPVDIFYDDIRYGGFFTGMTVTETVDEPFSMGFSLSFMVTDIFERWRLVSKGKVFQPTSFTRLA